MYSGKLLAIFIHVKEIFHVPLSCVLQFGRYLVICCQMYTEGGGYKCTIKYFFLTGFIYLIFRIIDKRNTTLIWQPTITMEQRWQV